jgi:hypothetical protein
MYFTLLGQHKTDLKFEIIFGDYSLENVRDERDAWKETARYNETDFKSFRIVKSGDKQNQIDMMVKLLNAEIA